MPLILAPDSEKQGARPEWCDNSPCQFRWTRVTKVHLGYSLWDESGSQNKGYRPCKLFINEFEDGNHKEHCKVAVEEEYKSLWTRSQSQLPGALRCGFSVIERKPEMTSHTWKTGWFHNPFPTHLTNSQCIFQWLLRCRNYSLRTLSTKIWQAHLSAKAWSV